MARLWVSSDSNNDSFKPWHAEGFKLRMNFDHIVLGILPSALLIVSLVFLTYAYTRMPVVIRRGWLLHSKLLSALVLLGLEAKILAFWSLQPPVYYSSLANISAFLSCIAVCCLAAFLDVEHRHSDRSSLFFRTILSISILFDIAKSRFYLSRSGSLTFVGTLLAEIAALKMLIVVLEGVSKTTPRLVGRQLANREDMSDSGGRSMLIWLKTTFFLGFQQVFDINDLTPLGSEFSASHLSRLFPSFWTTANTRSPPLSLWKPLLRSLARPALATIFPRFCYIGFVFAQIFLMRRIIVYVDGKNSSSTSAYELIGATLFIYLGIAISRALYTHLCSRLVTQARGVLLSQILRKGLKIKYTHANKNQAINLINTDIESLVTILHELWANFVEVGIAIYLLSRLVGFVACLAVIPLILSTISSYFSGQALHSARKAWKRKAQHRVTKTALMLKQIAGMKTLGIDSHISDYIQGLRTIEIEKSKAVRFLDSFRVIMNVFVTYMTPLFFIGGGILSRASSIKMVADREFPILATLRIMSVPLTKILQSHNNIISALDSIRQIQDFLYLEEIIERRTLLWHHEESQRESGVSSPSHSQILPRTHQSSSAIQLHYLSIKSLDGEYLIRNSSFNITQSTFTFITGPIARSKSSLLQAILGETEFEGTIQLNNEGNIAYCDRIPWVQSTTIRQNIVGEYPFDAAWYEVVVTACAMHEDLLQAINDDECINGSDGFALDQEQKQQIALARAIYSRAAIMIFDNVFNSFNAELLYNIISRLFSREGLLRSLGTTVIIASNLAHYASLADATIFLDENGNTTYGAFENGAQHTGFSRYTAAQSQYFEPLPPKNPESEHDAAVEEKTKEIAAMEAQEDRTLRRKNDFSLYIFYFQSTQRWLAFIFLTTLAFGAITEILPFIYIRVWLETQPDDEMFYVGYTGLVMIAVLSCAFCFWFFYYHILPDSSNTLHERLLNCIAGATLSFLTETDFGDILNRFGQDISIVTQELPRAVFMVIYMTISVVVDVGVILVGAQFTAAIAPLPLLICYVAQHFYVRTSRQIRFLELEAKTSLYNHFSETAAGLYHIRCFHLSEATLQVGLQYLDISQRSLYHTYFLRRWLNFTMDLTVLGIAITIVSFSVLIPQTTTQAAIGLSLLVMTKTGPNLVSMIQKWANLEESLGALVRIRSFITDTPQESQADQHTSLTRGWPESGHIVVNNLTVVSSLIDVPRPILANITLEIHSGQKVLLFGPSGSGKSSFILTLLNLLGFSGSIYISGLDITKIPQHMLRSQITTITQDPLELDGTLRYNLLPFRFKRSEEFQTTHDEEAVRALCCVRLWDYVTAQGGLDAPFSALDLSSGQKQLICIARAILHNRLTGSKIVLIDEGNSDVDSDTKRYIQEIFRKEFSHCTVIMATHQLETISRGYYSLFVELVDGKIFRVSS